MCVECCYQCWIDRNKACHNEIVQRERVMKWCQKVKEAMASSEYPQAKALARKSELDTSNAKTCVLQQWACNAKEMRRKAKRDLKMTCEDALNVEGKR